MQKILKRKFWSERSVDDVMSLCAKFGIGPSPIKQDADGDPWDIKSVKRLLKLAEDVHSESGFYGPKHWRGDPRADHSYKIPISKKLSRKMADAIMNIASWEDLPQGGDFWCDVHTLVEKGKYPDALRAFIIFAQRQFDETGGFGTMADNDSAALTYVHRYVQRVRCGKSPVAKEKNSVMKNRMSGDG